MTTYAEARDDAQLKALNGEITRFINRCKNPPASTSPCPQQTVFFFPGGMASRLVRANQPYQEGVGLPATVTYSPVWLTWETILGYWRFLRLHPDGSGSFRDPDDRIIIADAPLRLGSFTPHMLFSQWCKDNKANLFVFPWDWRRRLDETVGFFLNKFLPAFRQKVQADGCGDPLTNYSIVGHSFGGMIGNLVLRSGHPLTTNLKRVVTVGTPAYGHAHQLHRWFEGIPWVNFAETEFLENNGQQLLADASRFELLQVIASMPSLYTLPFLDELTYSSVGALLSAETPPYNQNVYSSLDATALTPADGFNPQVNGWLVRYPDSVGFDYDELDRGRAQFQLMAQAMSASMSKKFYNIRGVATELDGHTPLLNTVGSIKWGWVTPFYWPSTPCPITDDKPLVPGDDTHPAWSARLATNAASRTKPVKGPGINHLCLMNHPLIVARLAKILCASSSWTALFALQAQQTEMASEKEVKAFLRWVYSQRGRKQWPPLDEKLPKTFLPEEFRGNFEAILRRILSDVVRGSPPPTLKKAPGAPPARKNRRKAKRKGRKPSRKR
jgi:hypothetical protein